jgi:hypothetical protein
MTGIDRLCLASFLYKNRLREEKEGRGKGNVMQLFNFFCTVFTKYLLGALKN